MPWAAAVVAECAHRDGRFFDMLLALAGSGGGQGEQAWEIPWQEAAIEDVEAFEECLQMPADSFPRIRSGRALGEAAGVLGTPTVWLNGRLFAGRSLTDFRQAGRDLMRRGG